MHDVIASLLTSSGRAIEVCTVCKDCPSHPGLHVQVWTMHSRPTEDLGSF